MAIVSKLKESIPLILLLLLMAGAAVWLLNPMRLWGFPTTTLENIDGLLSQMFRLVLRGGRELEVAAGGGYYILNGVGYRLGYDYELGEAISSLYTELFEQYTGRWPYG